MKILRASQLGPDGNISGPLDCDLTTGLRVGGGTPTDNTALLNAALAAALTSVPVHLLIDGSTAHGGLVIAPVGHATIEGLGWDTGFFTKPGANRFALTNAVFPGAMYNPFDPDTAAPAIGTQGSIRLAHFRVNGNRGTYPNGVADGSAGTPYGPNPAIGYSAFTPGNGSLVWFTGIDLSTFNRLDMDDVWVYDAPAYQVRLCNFNSATIRNCRFETASSSGSINQDGIHISGPATDIKILGCYFKTRDDAIALNCPEGYRGNISNVFIDNCFHDNSNHGFRAYAGSYQLDNVLVRGARGSVVYFFCIHGIETNNAQTGSNGNISICDVDMQCGSAFVWLIGTGRKLTLSNCILRDNPGITGGPIPFLLGQNYGSMTMDEILVQGCAVQLSVSGHGHYLGSFVANCVINRLIIDGFSVTVPAGSGFSTSYLLDMNGGTINELVINGLNPSNLSALVNPARASSGFVGIGKISGSGLLASGFAVPDALVADGSPYLSSTSGLPSVKVAGVVHTFSFTAPLPGSLAGTPNVFTGVHTVSLTTIGTTDWAAFYSAGSTSTTAPPDQRKNGGSGLISSLVAIGSGSRTFTSRQQQGAGAGPFVLTWSDGSPTAIGSSTGEDWQTAGNNGIQITVPADTTLRHCTVYGFTWNTPIVAMKATLSDGSAAAINDAASCVSAASGNQTNFEYTFDYQAGIAGQTLTIQLVSGTTGGGTILGIAGVALF